jgi:hypothetical protein
MMNVLLFLKKTTGKADCRCIKDNHKSKFAANEPSFMKGRAGDKEADVRGKESRFLDARREAECDIVEKHVEYSQNSKKKRGWKQNTRRLILGRVVQNVNRVIESTGKTE